MAISSSMFVALTGMRMSQSAIEVASNNIANVNTPGYSRQRINLATMPTYSPASWGQMGTGVDANNIVRYHDDFLTRNLIMKGSQFANKSAQKAAIDTLEAYFNESKGNGINAAMNDFWATWDRVADDPENNPIREELIGVADIMTAQLKMRRNDMDLLRTDMNKRIDDAIGQINGITSQIASLNDQIVMAENPDKNQEANDLRDTREELLRQLAELIDISYYEDPHDGSVTITTPKGAPMVIRTSSYPLEARTDDAGDSRIYSSHHDWWTEDQTDSIVEGAVGGWVHFRDTTLRDYFIQYESFVDNFIFQVNNQHAQGVGQALFNDTTGTSLISNLPAYDFKFPGDDNDMRITALASHVPAKEPYNPMSDPDNLSIRFTKADSTHTEISSTVVWNDDPGVERWEITVTLPVDSAGNVTVTSEDVIRHINNEKSATPTGSEFKLPPQVSNPKIGDFISASASFNNNWSGRISFSGNSFPPGGPGVFTKLDRSLEHVMTQGHHLSYGSEYATLTTRLKHTDNDLIFTAADKGAAGEKIAIEYVAQSGNNQLLKAAVTDEPDGVKRITVYLGTDANGAVSTTSGEIAELINSNADTRVLVAAELPPDPADPTKRQKGLGLVKEMDKTYLDRSGSFDIVTYDKNNEPTFHRITVDPTDSLEDVVKQIGTNFTNGIPGLKAEVLTDLNGQSQLRIYSDTDNSVQYGFANDTSGALAVLGINNVLTGDSASNIRVNQAVVDNRRLIAAGRIDSEGNIKAGDRSNALDLADLKDKRFQYYHLNSATLGTSFNTIYSNIGTDSQVVTRSHDFLAAIVSQMQDQQDALAGVNLDEELADVLRFQYMYQASAKMISTIDSMMETLLAMK